VALAATEAAAGYIAVARDHDIWLLDAVTGRRIGVLQENGGDVAHICMDAFSARLACTVQTERKSCDFGNPEHYIKVWDLSTRKLIRIINSQAFRDSIHLCKDGTKVIATHHKKPKVFIYDTTTGKLILSLVNDPSTMLATCLRFTHDDNRFLVGYNNAVSSLFDSGSGDKIMEYRAATKGICVTQILCSPDGGTCFVLGTGLYAYDLVSGQYLWHNNSIILNMCFDIDCSGIFVSPFNMNVRRIDVTNGSVTMDVAVGGRVRLVAFNQANNSLILEKEGQIFFMGVATGEVTVIFDDWTGQVLRMCCSSPPTMVLM
jgi:WD40 repeat protein